MKAEEVRSRLGRLFASDKAVALAIFGLAFCLRLIVLAQARRCPWFDVPVVDPHDYDTWAKEIVSGTFLWQKTKIHGPLYPYFLALIYKIGGPFKYYLLRLVQFAIGSLNAVLLFLLARRIITRPGAILAGLAASIYWIFVYFEFHIFPVLLVTLLNLLLLMKLFANQESPRLRGWFIAGLILGFSSLGRPNAFLLTPFILGWIAVRAGGRRKAVPWMAGFLAGVILVIAPVTLRNYRVSRDFVPIQRNTGLNLYIGNNPDADGTPNVRPGAPWRELVNRPFKEDGLRKASLHNRFFISGVFQFIKDNPARFLRLQLRKFLYFWNHYEIKASMSPYFFTRYSSLLKGLSFILNFRIVAPLALLGMFILARNRRRTAPLYLFTLVYLGTVVFTVVSARYRTPILPCLLIFAAYSVVWGWERIKKRLGRPLALCASALVPFSLLVNLNFYRPDPRLEAEEYYNLGLAYLSKKNYPEAKEAYLEALKINPASARAYNGLGLSYSAFGRKEEAMDSFKKAIELDPGFVDPYNNLGNAYRKIGKREEAVGLYQKAIEVFPTDVRAYNNLGVLYEGIARKEEATAFFKKAVEIDPWFVDGYFNLGVVYGDTGKTEEAIASYQKAIEINPNSAKAYYNLGLLYNGIGRRRDAIDSFRRAIAIDPSFAAAHNNLAVAYYYEGKYDLAVRHCDRAIGLGYRVHPDLLEMLRPYR